MSTSLIVSIYFGLLLPCFALKEAIYFVGFLRLSVEAIKFLAVSVRAPIELIRPTVEFMGQTIVSTEPLPKL